MVTKKDKNSDRLVRHKRLRKKVEGTAERPRLCVFRSLRHLYAQIIDDTKGVTLVAASDMEKDIAAKVKKLNKTEAAKLVGSEIAKKALKKGISEVVFDRGGYIYIGRVEAAAVGAREAGLKF